MVVGLEIAKRKYICFSFINENVGLLCKIEWSLGIVIPESPSLDTFYLDIQYTTRKGVGNPIPEAFPRSVCETHY